MLLTRLIPPIVLIALPCASAAQASYPATVEFDLVFPRNDTYAPSAAFPIVFAIQNPLAAVPMWPYFEWILENSTARILFGLLSAYTDNLSNNTSGPYFAVDTMDLFNSSTKDGVFWLQWGPMVNNCTNGPFWGGWNNTGQSVVFTIKDGAQPPSIATSPTDCPIEPVTFNVTREIQIDPGQEFDGTHTVCPVLGIPPQPTPCAVQVDAAAASSLASMATMSACRSGYITQGCEPTPTSGGAAVRSDFGSLGQRGNMISIGLLISLAILVL